jgi:(p)ppGpp synthase/HD superfamily hydrolase
MSVENFDKQFRALRYLLLGRRYFTALKALEFGKETYRGTRKDGVTPELDHPITVTLFLATLESSFLYPELTLAASILHDVVEDHPPTIAQIESMFGSAVAGSVQRLTKQKDGIKRSTEEYYDSMSRDPIASLVKGADRIHNSQTMTGVFTLQKQQEYMEETRKHVLPMLKLARRRFPEQHTAYLNIKLLLVSQLQMLEQIHQAKRRP